MRQLKILAIIIVLAGVMYWGVEPYAHSVMHPHVSPADYNFAQEDIDLAKKNLDADKAAGDKQAIANGEAQLSAVTKFWDEVNKIDLSKGDAKKGAELFAGACSACHGAKVANLQPPMDADTAASSFGVVPPDLSTAGYLYEDKFLAGLIKDPVMALKLNHKFDAERPFPMTAYAGMGGNMDEEIADIVAYLKSIAPKKLSDKDVVVDACGRCHTVDYAGIKVHGNEADLKKYLGSTPPDLSVMIRSRGSEYLLNFINDPQKLLHGTAMPRVGLKQSGEDQVVAFLQKVGDPKKEQRETVGIYIMIYFVILAIFATLWKRKVWSKLH